jgi:hypothetical protein
VSRQWYLDHREEVIAKSKRWAEDHPGERKKNSEKYYAANKEKAKKRSVDWDRNHPEIARDRKRHWDQTHKKELSMSYMYRSYGLKKEDYANLMESQDYKCKLCGKELALEKKPCVDHNHKTGFVRGILCSKCNVGLGQFGDSPEFLRRAAKYIEDNGG